jgi:hypothetical protein
VRRENVGVCSAGEVEEGNSIRGAMRAASEDGGQFEIVHLKQLEG